MRIPLSLAGRPIRHLGSMLLIPAVAIIVAACSSAASPSSSANLGAPTSGASAAATIPATGSTGPLAVPAPVSDTTLTGVTPSGTSVGAASTGIAYPYPIFGGTPGVAPDHSILVTGSGQASLKADGSNAAAAERTALTTALVEAKRRADEVAAATGVTIRGVLSVSVSDGQSWIAPMGIESPGGAPMPPTSRSAPATTPSTLELNVTVTIAYTIGS
jgi:hypothetical protein